jgi:hypothetical protein
MFNRAGDIAKRRMGERAERRVCDGAHVCHGDGVRDQLRAPWGEFTESGVGSGI